MSKSVGITSARGLALDAPSSLGRPGAISPARSSSAEGLSGNPTSALRLRRTRTAPPEPKFGAEEPPSSPALYMAATPCRRFVGSSAVGGPPSPVVEADAEDGFDEAGTGEQLHIRVAVRVRPVPPGDMSIIETAGERGIAVHKVAGTGGNEFLKSQQGRTEERLFDRVFGPEAQQADVYTFSCRPLVVSAVEEGKNATVFVYGATGAGKTHTIFGERDEVQQGLIYRAVRETFARLSSHHSRDALEVKVSFLDIYNETVRDLLDGGNVCKVLEDDRQNIVKVTNLKEVIVTCPDEAFAQLRVGVSARKVEATAANARSSRSHAVFSLTIERIVEGGAGPGMSIFRRRGETTRRPHAKICLIDLAGSERATQTQNVGTALKDGARINQSLLALANCIDALATRATASAREAQRGDADGFSAAKGRDQLSKKKVPFRDSKLTLLLKSSLTSECLVSMIANVHPGRDHFEDSNNTLEYAKRASIVRAPPVVRRSSRASMPSSMPRAASSPPMSPGNSSFAEISDPELSDGGVAAQAAPPTPPRPGRGLRLPSGNASSSGRRGSGPAAASAPPASAAPSTPPSDSSFDTAEGGPERGAESPRCASQEHSRAASRSSARAQSAHSASSPAPPLSRDPSLLDISPGSPGDSPRGTSARRRPASRGRRSQTPTRDVQAAQRGRDQRHAAALAAAAAEAPSPPEQPRRAPEATSKEASCLGRTTDDEAASTAAPPQRVAPSASQGGAGSASSSSAAPDVELLLRIVETLQSEKRGLDAQLRAAHGECERLMGENGRLQAANLEKDRQMSALLKSAYSEKFEGARGE